MYRGIDHAKIVSCASGIACAISRKGLTGFVMRGQLRREAVHSQIEYAPVHAISHRQQSMGMCVCSTKGFAKGSLPCLNS